MKGIYKRIKRYWELTNKDPKALEKFESLTEEEIAFIPEISDEKAVFFGNGTEEEFKEIQKEDSGMKAWYERLKNL